MVNWRLYVALSVAIKESHMIIRKELWDSMVEVDSIKVGCLLNFGDGFLKYFLTRLWKE